MRSGNSSTHGCSRGPPDATNRIEEGRIIRLFISSGRGLATIPPASHRLLELDLALGRLNVLEKTIDDLLHRNPLRLGGKIRKHAVTQHRSRDTHDVRG